MYTHGCVRQCRVLCFLVKYDVLLKYAIYSICCDKGCVLWSYSCFIIVDIYMSVLFYIKSVNIVYGLLRSCHPCYRMKLEFFSPFFCVPELDLELNLFTVFKLEMKLGKVMDKIFCGLIGQVGCWTDVFPTLKTANSNLVDDKIVGRKVQVGGVAYIFLKKNDGLRWHTEWELT